MAVVLTLDISWCCAACWKSHQRGTHHKQAIHSPLWAASWGFWVSSCCSSMENQSGMHTWGKNLWARVSRSLSSEIHWHLSVFSPLKRCRVQPQRRFQIYRVAGPMKMTGKDEQMLEIDFQEGLAVSESELCGCDLRQFWEATATSKWRSLLAPRGELSKECQDVKSQQGSRPHKLVESMSHHERTVVNLENSEWTSKSLSRDIQGTFWFSQQKICGSDRSDRDRPSSFSVKPSRWRWPAEPHLASCRWKTLRALDPWCVCVDEWMSVDNQIQMNTIEYNGSILYYTSKTSRVGYPRSCFSPQALFQLALFDDFGARMSEVQSLLREVQNLSCAILWKSDGNI